MDYVEACKAHARILGSSFKIYGAFSAMLSVARGDIHYKKENRPDSDGRDKQKKAAG